MLNYSDNKYEMMTYVKVHLKCCYHTVNVLQREKENHKRTHLATYTFLSSSNSVMLYFYTSN